VTHLRFQYLLAAIRILIAEILVATVFSDIIVIRSYISDYLVVILLFCLVKSFWNVPSLALAISVFIFACIIESAQYFHLANVLGLHSGSVLRILIGTSFSWIDILMYLGGCLTSYFLSTRHFHIRNAFTQS
jgi:hypothetical protein